MEAVTEVVDLLACAPLPGAQLLFHSINRILVGIQKTHWGQEKLNELACDMVGLRAVLYTEDGAPRLQQGMPPHIVKALTLCVFQLAINYSTCLSNIQTTSRYRDIYKKANQSHRCPEGLQKSRKLDDECCSLSGANCKTGMSPSGAFSLCLYAWP